MTPEEAAIRAQHAELLSPGWFAAGIVMRDAVDEAAAGSAPVFDQKAFATLQARAAIAGFQLERMADGSFVAACGLLACSLADVGAVEAFLKQLGAQ